MKKIPDNAPDLIRWVNYIIHTKPINTIAGVVLSVLGVGVSAGGIYLIKYSLSADSEDIEPLSKKAKNLSLARQQIRKRNKIITLTRAERNLSSFFFMF